jgi:hypothetical protein
LPVNFILRYVYKKSFLTEALYHYKTYQKVSLNEEGFLYITFFQGMDWIFMNAHIDLTIGKYEGIFFVCLSIIPPYLLKILRPAASNAEKVR